MSYTILGAEANTVAAQVGTNAEISEALGTDVGGPDGETCLVLNDMGGNDQALVLSGTADEFMDLAGRILTQALTIKYPDAQHRVRLHLGSRTNNDVERLSRKCAHCHLFVEEQDEEDIADGAARFIHLHRGDDADEALDETHEAEPEPGPGAPLTWWKLFGPAQMRARFIDDETVDVLGDPLPRGRCDECGSPCDAVTGKCMREPEQQCGGAAVSGQKRSAFYVDETMKTEHGYVPSLVTEGEPGHAPLVGNGDHASPWYWGQDIETARRVAAEANAQLGLTPQDVLEIVLSSMTARE